MSYVAYMLFHSNLKQEFVYFMTPVSLCHELEKKRKCEYTIDVFKQAFYKINECTLFLLQKPLLNLKSYFMIYTVQVCLFDPHSAFGVGMCRYRHGLEIICT
jgi:hypothetical protein